MSSSWKNNLHVQCRSNLARDTHRSTFVRFSWPGLISTLLLGPRVKRNASCKRAIHFVHMAGWNLTRDFYLFLFLWRNTRTSHPWSVRPRWTLVRLRLCLHEKFQPGSSSARVESLYDRQKRWAFTWRQLTRVKYWYAAKSPLLHESTVPYSHVNLFARNCMCSAVQTWREIRTEVRLYDFLDPGWFQPSPWGEGWNQPGAKFQPGSSAMRHVNAPFILCTWRVEIWPGSNSTRVETPHVNTA